MKNLFAAFALLIAVSTVSCKKESEVKPANAPAGSSTINIEYRVTSQSGNVAVDYIAPDSNTGELKMKHADVNRTEMSFSFNYASGYHFSVSASNIIPSHNTVQVQIFVNGVLKAENSTTNPSQNAIAAGNF